MVIGVVTAGCGSSGGRASGTTSTSTTGGTSTTVAGARVEISIVGGQVVGGPARVEVAVGESVTFRITSDAAEEVHVHGYDLKASLTPGTAAEVSFVADIPGVFEVELEGSGLKVADLQVG
jgi:plastocyanin